MRPRVGDWRIALRDGEALDVLDAKSRGNAAGELWVHGMVTVSTGDFRPNASEEDMFGPWSAAEVAGRIGAGGEELVLGNTIDQMLGGE